MVLALGVVVLAGTYPRGSYPGGGYPGGRCPNTDTVGTSGARPMKEH